MIVVSDTSPIRALAFLEQLTVLEQLFGTVVIPPAVIDELAHPARLARGESPVDLSRFPFIQVRIPAGQAQVEELAEELDRGESEAIVLAEELHCPAILMDEAAGRASSRHSAAGWRVIREPRPVLLRRRRWTP